MLGIKNGRRPQLDNTGQRTLDQLQTQTWGVELMEDAMGGVEMSVMATV